jgi:hypothetical protein
MVLSGAEGIVDFESTAVVGNKVAAVVAVALPEMVVLEALERLGIASLLAAVVFDVRMAGIGLFAAAAPVA